MKKMTAIVALATFALGNLTVAHGESNPQQRSETVKFGDLDVNTERGATRLFERLSLAASRVCRDPDEGHLPVMRIQLMQCRHQAIGTAVGTVGAPAVTSIAREHGVEPLVSPARP
jgi:UrcA family protein